MSHHLRATLEAAVRWWVWIIIACVAIVGLLVLVLEIRDRRPPKLDKDA